MVAFLERLCREMRYDRVPYAIVISLDFVPAWAAARSDEMGCAQQGENALAFSLEIRRPVRDSQLDRHTGDRNHVEEAPRPFAKPAHTRAYNPVQRELPRPH